MPVLILILKMGIIMSFIITTQASFTDERIFPSSKRNTSVGTCGMIARSVTIVAPIVNEWAAPIPIVVMLAFAIVGLVTSATFPDESEFVVGEKQEDKTYNLNENIGDADSDLTQVNMSSGLKDGDSMANGRGGLSEPTPVFGEEEADFAQKLEVVDKGSKMGFQSFKSTNDESSS